jgi:hypothetical protein
LCGRLTLDFTDACNAYAAHKGTNGGGRATNLASLRRFCAIAANVNSDWAPHGPRNRSRPSRRIRFKCANSISTRFLSRDDCLNASVLASARATISLLPAHDRRHDDLQVRGRTQTGHLQEFNSDPSILENDGGHVRANRIQSRIAMQAQLQCGNGLDEQLETVSAQIAPRLFRSPEISLPPA